MNMDAAHAIFGSRICRRVLGIQVAGAGWREAIDMMAGRLRDRKFTRVTFLNAHNANIAATDPAFAHALEDFLVLPDGVGIDIASKLLYGSSFPANLNGTDFIPALLKTAASPLTVALLGASPGIAEAAAARLAAMAPRHRIVVIGDGYFPAEEEMAILGRIANLRPDILLVAMGVPRQELWIARHIDARHCTLPIAVGALFDFLSGSVPRAPLWLRRVRLEWLFRLIVEPRRLWRRYLIGNPVFLWRVLRQKFFGMPAPAGRNSLGGKR
jgi:exopolysaccharide biosynthesis WecB/TagA/CpsF family protein